MTKNNSSSSSGYTYTGSGTNTQVSTQGILLQPSSNTSLGERATTTAVVRVTVALAATITQTRQSFLLYIPLCFTRDYNRNGSYYYSNPNGSTYYNSGSGYSQYTSPSGQTSKSTGK